MKGERKSVAEIRIKGGREREIKTRTELNK